MNDTGEGGPASPAPKSIYQLLEVVSQEDLKSSSKRKEKSMKMLKAYCRRCKEKNITVNNTVFSFNKEGYCEIADIGNSSLDFELMCKKYGAEVLTNSLPKPVEPPARPKDERKGIDAPLLEEPEPVLESTQEDEDEDLLTIDEEELWGDIPEPDLEEDLEEALEDDKEESYLDSDE